MLITNNKKNNIYNGTDGKIFRKTLLNQITSLTSYSYNYSKDYTEEYFKNKNLDFVTSVSPDNFTNTVLYLKKSFIIVSEFENKSIKGILFKNSKYLYGLIFTPQESTIDKNSSILNRDIYTFTLSELNRIKNEHDLFFLDEIKKFPLDLYCAALINCIAYKLNISIKTFLILLYENSLNEYIKYFNKCKSGEINSYNLFQNDECTHTQICSFYYYWTLKILKEVLPEKNIGYSFHDVGTQMAFLPAILLKLNRNELMNIKINSITASDYVPPSPELEKWIKIYTDNSKHVEFNFNSLDLTDLNMDYPDSDITVVIDVIEHLPSEDAALKSVLKLWKHTNEILIIHVPFETKHNKWHDHNMLFNTDKLRKWSAYFKGGRYLSDSFKDGKYNCLADLGFLIIQAVP